MGIEFKIPEYKKIRVIIDTDAACEADDPFAIVHGLLSPKLVVKGITAEHFNTPGSMEASYDEINTILREMDMEIPVFCGQKGPLSGDAAVSEAAGFIVEEGLRDDEKPLYILCQGAVTNVAKALQTEPRIRDRMTVIWIGTHGEAPNEAPFREFNAGNDIEAANYLLQSGIELWLVPSLVYGTIHIGIAEIEHRIRPCGKIGEHLYTNLVNYNMSDKADWTQGESWSLGDSPAIAIALNPACGHYHIGRAPLVADDTSSVVKEDNPLIRIYTDVDSRYILEDLISKLNLRYGRR
ncbi:MAG: nucleoside hydrolase [Lachnospiraceae bacterium]|nr:nucleoside hydrolase [Lachnospiraceae bacterium]